MNQKQLIQIIFCFVVIVGALMWYYYQQPHTVEPVPEQEKFQSNELEPTESGYAFEKLLQTDSKVFYCRTRTGTESGCALFVSDIAGTTMQDLHAYIDYGSLGKNILVAPGGAHLLFVQQDHDNQATLLTTESLEQEVIYEAPVGYVLGTYTDFPSFVPYLQWISESQIEVSIFPQYTAEPHSTEPRAVPFATHIIEIN